MRRHRDQGLAGAGRRRQHQVAIEHELEHRLLLRGIQTDALLARPIVEDRDEGIRIPIAGRTGGGKAIGQHAFESALLAVTGVPPSACGFARPRVSPAMGVPI